MHDGSHLEEGAVHAYSGRRCSTGGAIEMLCLYHRGYPERTTHQASKTEPLAANVRPPSRGHPHGYSCVEKKETKVGSRKVDVKGFPGKM